MTYSIIQRVAKKYPLKFFFAILLAVTQNYEVKFYAFITKRHFIICNYNKVIGVFFRDDIVISHVHM